MTAALAQILACPACAAGDSGDLAGALLLGAMIVAPLGIAAALIPTIARILRGREDR